MDPITMMALGAGVQTLGGIAGGLLQGESQRDIARAQKRMYARELEQAGMDWNQIQQYLGITDPAQLGADVNARYETLGGLAGQQIPTLGEFDTSAFTPDAFLNPYLDFQQQQGIKALQQAAASRGAPRGGAYDLALQQRAQNIAGSEYWGNAFDRANQAQQQAYGRYTDKYKADLAQAQDAWERAQNMYSAASGRASQGATAFGNYSDTTRGLRMDRDTAGIAEREARFGAMANAIPGIAGGIGNGMMAYGQYSAMNPAPRVDPQGFQYNQSYTNNAPATMPSMVNWDQYAADNRFNTGATVNPNAGVDYNMQGYYPQQGNLR